MGDPAKAGSPRAIAIGNTSRSKPEFYHPLVLAAMELLMENTGSLSIKLPASPKSREARLRFIRRVIWVALKVVLWILANYS